MCLAEVIVMVIEVPTQEDFGAVTVLARQIHRLHVSWRPDLFCETEEPLPMEEFLHLVHEGNIFVTRADGEVVAYATCSIRERVREGYPTSKALWLDALCVREDKRGTGIGTQLLNAVLDRGKSLNCTDMGLSVSVENENAIQFYKKFGMRAKNIAYQMKLHSLQQEIQPE